MARTKNHINNDNNNITRFRKEQSKKHGIKKFVVFLIVILALFMLYLFKDTVFEPFEGIAARLGGKDVGYPISMSGSADYDVALSGKDLSLLTDSHLTFYTNDGIQLGEFQHSLNSPVMKTSDNRILIYDKSGKNFKFYSKTKLLYEKTVDEPIVYGVVGNHNNVAIVTTSSYYMNTIYVFNAKGELVYTWKSANNIVKAVFSRDDSKLYITDLSAEKTIIKSTIYCFDIKNEVGPEWQYDVIDNMPFEVIRSQTGVMSIYSNGIRLFSELTGELIASYDYSSQLVDFSVKDGRLALLFYDNTINAYTITVLDKDLKPLASKSDIKKINDIVMMNNEVIMLSDSTLVHFDFNLAEISEQSLDEDYAQFVCIGNDVFLINLDYINKISNSIS